MMTMLCLVMRLSWPLHARAGTRLHRMLWHHLASFRSVAYREPHFDTQVPSSFCVPPYTLYPQSTAVTLPSLMTNCSQGKAFVSIQPLLGVADRDPKTAARARHSSVPNLHICGVKGSHTHVVKPKSRSRVEVCHETLQQCCTLAWQVLEWQDTHPSILVSWTGRFLEGHGVKCVFIPHMNASQSALRSNNSSGIEVLIS